MLRVAMLKLKRTWSLALRYRGDARFPGRFHRLMMKTAQKSTNTDKDNQWTCKQIIDYLFSPLRTHDEIRRIQGIILSDIKRLQRAINKQKAEQKPECIPAHVQCVRCAKIIAYIFGEAKPQDFEKVLYPKAPLEDAPVEKAPVEEIATVLSTTAKQTEEELAQKVELINETPLVEAEKPAEDFNIHPNVLGNDFKHSLNIETKDSETYQIRNKAQIKFKKMVRKLENSEIMSKVTPITYGVVSFSGTGSKQGRNSDDKSAGGKQDKNESLANKRDHKTPKNALESSLIKEMQQLSVPHGSGNSSINVQMGASKKHRKPKAELIELEARKCEQESPAASEEDLKIDIRTLRAKKSPKPSVVSSLREEGIRYTEQTTPNFEDKKQEKEHSTESTLLLDLHNPILEPNNKKTDKDIEDQQKVAILNVVKSKEQPSTTELQVLKLPEQTSPWPYNHIYFQDLTQIASELTKKLKLNHSGVHLTDEKPPYDPHKPIIDPHDKKTIASDTETYGYEPLSYHMANVAGLNKTEQKSHPKELEKPPSILPSQTTESNPEGTHPGMVLNRDMSYYYYNNYVYSNQYPNQQQNDTTLEDQSQEIRQQESSRDYEYVPAEFNENTSAQSVRNNPLINNYNDVPATDMKSKSDPTEPANVIQNTCANVRSVRELHDSLMAAADTKEQPFNEMVYKNSESSDLLYYQNPWINQYSNSQQQQVEASDENIPKDENPDHIHLDQHTGDPSFEEVPNYCHWMNQQYPISPDARVSQVEQLQATLYMTDPNKGPPGSFQPRFSGFPDPFNPWNQFPYPQNPSSQNRHESQGTNVPDSITSDRRPAHYAHKPLVDNGSHYKKIPDQKNEVTKTAVQPWPTQQLQSNVTQQTFYTNSSPFQQPAGFVAHAPRFYQQTFTSYVGQFPFQQNFWGNQPQGLMSEYQQRYQQQFVPTKQQAPETGNQDVGLTPDQNTSNQAIKVRPILKDYQDSNIQPPAGPSAAFISLPKVNWRDATALSSSLKEKSLPEKEMQMDSTTWRLSPKDKYLSDEEMQVNSTSLRPSLKEESLPEEGTQADLTTLRSGSKEGSLPNEELPVDLSTLGPSPKEESLPEEEVHVNLPETRSTVPEIDVTLAKDESIPLSEILRRVRRRSQGELIALWTQLDPVEGKCGDKKPPCPPPTPVCPPVEPAPCVPCPCPNCPRPCRPNSYCPRPNRGCPPPAPSCPPPKCPACKFVALSLVDTLYNILTVIWEFGCSILIHRTPLGSCCLTESGECATNAIKTNDIATQLRLLGNSWYTMYYRKLVTFALARNFGPWVSAPSWPKETKYKKKQLTSPKEGTSSQRRRSVCTPILPHKSLPRVPKYREH